MTATAAHADLHPVDRGCPACASSTDLAGLAEARTEMGIDSARMPQPPAASAANHVYYWGHAFRDDILGPDRAATLDAAASALRHGLRISLHSDYRVTPISPLRSVQTAVTRELRAGGTLNPAESITVEEAMRAITIDAAWQTNSEDHVGSPEVGKYADLVILSADPQKVAPHEIADITVRTTRLAGRAVER